MRNLSFLLQTQRRLGSGFRWPRASYTPGFLRIRKAVSARAAAAGGLGTKAGSLQTELVIKDRTQRGTHGCRVRRAATPVKAQRLTFCIRETGRGQGAPDARHGGRSVLRGLPHAARRGRAGSLPPEERGERLS